MSLPVDHDKRLLALDAQQSFCVIAPAGSGKTELLVQRILALLATVNHPEEILAITFTRKAAAEMRQRVMSALNAALTQPKPELSHQQLTWQLAKQVLERDAQQNWQLLLNSRRLRIQTIDGFCSSLTQQMPVLTGFGGQLTVSDAPDHLYQMAVHELLDQLHRNDTVADDLSILIAHLDYDYRKAERLLISLLQRRDQWLVHIGFDENSDRARNILQTTLDELNRDGMCVLASLLKPFASDLVGLIDYAATAMAEAQPDSAFARLSGITELPACSMAGKSDWLLITDFLLTAKHEWRKSVNKNQGFIAGTDKASKEAVKEKKAQYQNLLAELSLQKGLLDALEELCFLPNAVYKDKQWQFLQVLTRLLNRLVAHLQVVFQQVAEVDYTEITMAALRGLGYSDSPSELALKLDYRIKHILVDEFQDTSSTQYQLLSRLVEGWQESNHTDNSQHTLFIVGDGMQSIYRFREANVGLFLEARRHGINGVKLIDAPLSANFRSQANIIDWVNRVFSVSFPDREHLTRGAIPYNHSVAVKSELPGEAVELFGFVGDNSQTAEADQVVQLVQSARSRNPQGSIALLVRSRNHLQEILPALKSAGIEWSATDIDALNQRDAVMDLLTLTKALLNTADRIAWLALLRAPWCGLSNSDCYYLLNNADAGQQQQSVWKNLQDLQTINKISIFARERLPEIVAVLRKTFAQRRRKNLREWIEGAWLALGGPATLANIDDCDDVERYFELLDSYDEGCCLSSLSAFEDAVAGLFAQAANKPECLQIMTIHKSKGLEFDTVIIPGLAKRSRADDRALLQWSETLTEAGHQGVLLAALGATSADNDAVYEYLHYENKKKAALEDLRLFYVAATRAAEHLYLLFSVEEDDAGEIKSPSNKSLIGSVWNAVKEDINWIKTQGPTEQQQIDLNFASAVSQDLLLQRLPGHWRLPSLDGVPNDVTETSLASEDIENQVSAIQSLLSEDYKARVVGTVVHLILEKLSVLGVRFWIKQSQSDKASLVQQLLRQQSTRETDLAHCAEEVIHNIEKTVKDTKGQWILSNQFLEQDSELILSTVLGERTKQFVIDRTVVDHNKVRWIIDYKTAAKRDEEVLRDFIDREAQLYQPQLSVYKSLFNPSDYSAIKTALYFTHYAYWHEVRCD